MMNKKRKVASVHQITNNLLEIFSRFERNADNGLREDI